MKSTTTTVEVRPSSGRTSKIYMELSHQDLAKVLAGLTPADLRAVLEHLDTEMFIKTDKDKRKFVNTLQNSCLDLTRSLNMLVNLHDVR